MDQIDTSQRIPLDEHELRAYDNLYRERVDSVFEKVGQDEFNLIALQIAQREEAFLRERMPDSPLLQILDMARQAGMVA